MSVKCDQSIDELTVQVWLLYHLPNFKYCTLCVRGTELRTDGRTDRRSDYWLTFQAGGIKTHYSQCYQCKRRRTWLHSVYYDSYPVVCMLDVNKSLEVGGILVVPFIYNWQLDDIYWLIDRSPRSRDRNLAAWKHPANYCFDKCSWPKFSTYNFFYAHWQFE